MGQYYYINTKAGLSQAYLVHCANCISLPSREERLFLGTFYAPLDALKQARKYYAHAELCKNCSPASVKNRAAVQRRSSSHPFPSC